MGDIQHVERPLITVIGREDNADDEEGTLRTPLATSNTGLFNY